MAQEETWTVGRLLNWTTDYLKKHGAESPRLDAEVLLAHARGCQRIELYTAFETDPGEQVRTAFRDLVRRRAEGTPVAYLVGRREFFSLSFRVTPDVLIPRPETEHVVVALLDLVKGREEEPWGIADIGTGSGILAVCAAKHIPGSRVTAVDISALALDVARCNAEDHGVAERIEFVESDLFAAVPAERRYDFVVSNPPYVTAREMEQLPPTVKDHEPHAALAAGPRGTDVIARLIDQSAERLKPGGWLLCEISPMLQQAVEDLFAADARWEPRRYVKDYSGRVRVVQARRKGRTNIEH
jgi:release factor glutamine methyltransferase